jgi:hypothetical protein
VRDHCFRLDEARRWSWPGWPALRAGEIADRASPPEVQGTIWIDAQTSALQSVDFMDQLRGDLKNVGGEVVFARVDSGPGS